MSYYRFKKNDIVLNRVEANPKNRIYISNTNVYHNNSNVAGSKPIKHVSGSSLIVKKDSIDQRPNFLTHAEFLDSSQEMVKDYYLSSSITVSSDYVSASSDNNRLRALRNTLDYYKKNSPHYAYSSSMHDKTQEDLRIISIPSLVFGSSIEKGSVDLKFYVTGTLAGQLKDENKNGELIQVSEGTGTGSVAGVVLYNEGFLIMTGSWDLDTSTSEPKKWRNFGATGSLSDSTFDINFNGTTFTPVMTMFAHANRGELNSSNNPTFVQSGSQKVNLSSSFMYIENSEQQVENVVSSSFQDTGSFEKTTYISSIGIYDEDDNLVGIAKTASPIRKRERDSYTFKMKLDL
jgi:hypothetical protein